MGGTGTIQVVTDWCQASSHSGACVGWRELIGSVQTELSWSQGEPSVFLHGKRGDSSTVSVEESLVGAWC